MRKECTELFLHYREVARLVWNLGFWPNPALREFDSVELYEEIATRLFEGLVYQALGFEARIEKTEYPGALVEFQVEVDSPGVELLVNKNLPGEPGRVWGHPVVQLTPGQQQLRFIDFFDWSQLAPRDFRLLEVRIEGFGNHPELVGRHGLVPLDRCSVWMVCDESSQDAPLSTRNAEPPEGRSA
jgi:hypothetical protein